MTKKERRIRQKRLIRSGVIVATIRWVVYSIGVVVVPLVISVMYIKIPDTVFKYLLLFFELLGLLFYIQEVDYIITDQFY